MVESSVQKTPLPKVQLAITFLIQFAEPITATVIYPFAPQAVRRSGITNGDEKALGYYAGIVESAFFLLESLSVYFWGRASDFFGRRILVVGPLGLAIGAFGFGFSKSFWALVFFRGLQGVFNGNIGVSKTVVSELTDATNIGDVFTVMPILWSVGITTGNAIGGVLSNPATKWPDSLGKIAVLRDNPFLLPCAVTGILAFVTFVFAFVGLKETSPLILNRRKLKRRDSHSSTASLISETDSRSYGSIIRPAPEPEPLEEAKGSKLKELMTSERYPQTLLTYCFMSFTDMCYSALIPLVYSTSIPLGGLGFTPHTIGIIMATYGAAGAVIQILVLSRVLNKFGPRRTIMMAFCTQFLGIASFPCMAFFAKRAGEVTATVWTIVVFQMCCNIFGFVAYSAIGILIVDSSPSPGALASANSVAQMASCALRTFAPTTALSLFSLSLEHNLLGGKLVYFLLMSGSVTSLAVASRLPPKMKMSSEP